MDFLAGFPRRRIDVAARVIGDEAVVVTPADSLVHELNTEATFVWERCDGSRNGRELAAAMTEAFEVAAEVAERDLEELLRVLSRNGLIDVQEQRVERVPET